MESQKIRVAINGFGRIGRAFLKLSFGRDVWNVHQDILQKYQDNELIFEEDPDAIKN